MDAPPAQAAPAPAQAAPAHGGADEEGRNLHDIAVDAQTDIQKLATGLAHAGAAPQAVQELTQMSSILSDVVKVLAQGPAVDQAAQAGPAAHQPMPQAQAQTALPQAGPAQPQQAQAQPPSPHGEAIHSSIDAATKNLHAAMIASKQQRQSQGQ